MKIQSMVQSISWSDKKYTKIFILYLFMVSGGLLHLSGYFDRILGTMATFIMFGITSWLVYEFIMFFKKMAGGDDIKKVSFIFYLWIAAIFVFSIVVEIIGVQTGAVFGVYRYGDVLTPFIGPVPLAIGFAWINILLPSLVLAKYFIQSEKEILTLMVAILTGIFMVLFDVIMEPSAIVLGYWRWAGGSIPLQNYAVWFIIGSIFAFAGLRLRIFQFGIPLILIHAYVAQLLYFGLVAIK